MAQVSFNFSENREHRASVAPLSPPVTEAGHAHTHLSSDWRKVETGPCPSLGVTDGGELALPVLSVTLRIVTTIHSRLLAHTRPGTGAPRVSSHWTSEPRCAQTPPSRHTGDTEAQRPRGRVSRAFPVLSCPLQSIYATPACDIFTRQ